MPEFQGAFEFTLVVQGPAGVVVEGTKPALAAFVGGGFAEGHGAVGPLQGCFALGGDAEHVTGVGGEGVLLFALAHVPGRFENGDGLFGFAR